jgi:hypothetical protein
MEVYDHHPRHLLSRAVCLLQRRFRFVSVARGFLRLSLANRFANPAADQAEAGQGATEKQGGRGTVRDGTEGHAFAVGKSVSVGGRRVLQGEVTGERGRRKAQHVGQHRAGEEYGGRYSRSAGLMRGGQIEGVGLGSITDHPEVVQGAAVEEPGRGEGNGRGGRQAGESAGVDGDGVETPGQNFGGGVGMGTVSIGLTGETNHAGDWNSLNGLGQGHGGGGGGEEYQLVFHNLFFSGRGIRLRFPSMSIGSAKRDFGLPPAGARFGARFIGGI